MEVASEGQLKADRKEVSLKAPVTERDSCPLTRCPGVGVYSGPAEQCYSWKTWPASSTGLARGAMCPPPGLSPRWVSGALGHSHAACMCHHRGFFFF